MSYGNSWFTILLKKKKGGGSLNDTDGQNYFWKNLQRQLHTFFNRWQGDKSLMIWRAICFYSQTYLTFLNGGQNSKRYHDTLEKHPLSFEEILGDPDCRFQHKNASINTSHGIKQWLTVRNITAFDLPA